MTIFKLYTPMSSIEVLVSVSKSMKGSFCGLKLMLEILSESNDNSGVNVI